MSIFKLGRWSDREKAGVLLAAGVLLLGATYLLVWRPVRQRLADLDLRIQDAQRELAANQRVLASDLLEAVDAEYRQYGERLHSARSAAEENAGLLRVLEELATLAGVSLIATKPQDMAIKSDHEEYEVELDLEGDAPHLVAFLHGVYAAPQMLRVSSFELERKDKVAPMKGRIRVTKTVTR
jgi:type II secretory pathway component PulM